MFQYGSASMMVTHPAPSTIGVETGSCRMDSIPDKAKSVEIGNAGRFLEWSKDQPAMVLHELAHSYLDRVLGLNHPGIKAAYERAVMSGIYNSVLRNNGKMERAYALTNVEEYFAEASEAFFGTNDFYPFVRVELEKHDPRLYDVLVEVWSRR